MQQNSRTLSSCKTETLHSSSNLSPSPPSQPLATTVLFSVSMNLTTLGTSNKWNHTYLSFSDCLISLTVMSSTSSMLEPGSEFPSSLRLNDIPVGVGLSRVTLANEMLAEGSATWRIFQSACIACLGFLCSRPIELRQGLGWLFSCNPSLPRVLLH